MTNQPSENVVPTGCGSLPAQGSIESRAAPDACPDRDWPHCGMIAGLPSEPNDFERERERQSRVARQHLRESLDRRKRFDGWMVVLLGFAIALWVQIVVTTLIRSPSP